MRIGLGRKKVIPPDTLPCHPWYLVMGRIEGIAEPSKGYGVALFKMAPREEVRALCIFYRRDVRLPAGPSEKVRRKR